MKSVLAVVVLFFSFSAFADLQKDYLDLKDQGRNLQDTGAICEEVARIEMQREYGDQYEVLSGIEYSGQSGTIGELDIIVFDRRSNQAVLIGEVKCWKDMRDGLKKAEDQRQRFIKNINSSRALYFRLKDDSNIRFTKQQFNKNPKFIFIAQKGGVSAGYDLELEHTLAELMNLRSMILRCQSSGVCKRPANYREF